MQDGEDAVILTHWRREGNGWVCEPGDKHPLVPLPAYIYRAMMVGLHDYVTRNRFPGVVLGLSGGIDSALSAALAVPLSARWCRASAPWKARLSARRAARSSALSTRMTRAASGIATNMATAITSIRTVAAVTIDQPSGHPPKMRRVPVFR